MLHVCPSINRLTCNRKVKQPTANETVSVAYHCPIETCKYSFTQGRYFTKRPLLKQHFRKVHCKHEQTHPGQLVSSSGQPSPIIVERQQPPIDSPHQCSCGLRYRSLPALYTHARRHDHKLEAFTCHRCGESFCCREELNVHKSSYPIYCNPHPSSTPSSLSWPSSSTTSSLSWPSSSTTSSLSWPSSSTDLGQMNFPTLPNTFVSPTPPPLPTPASVSSPTKKKVAVSTSTSSVQVDTLSNSCAPTSNSSTQANLVKKGGSVASQSVQTLRVDEEDELDFREYFPPLGDMGDSGGSCNNGEDDIDDDMVLPLRTTDLDDSDSDDVATGTLTSSRDICLASLSNATRSTSSMSMTMMMSNSNTVRDDIIVSWSGDDNDGQGDEPRLTSNMETQTSVLDLFDFHEMPRRANMETQTSLLCDIQTQT